MCRVFQIIDRSVISGKLFKTRWRLVSSLNQDRTGRHPWADWERVASSLKKTRLPMISQRQVSRTIDCWGHAFGSERGVCGGNLKSDIVTSFPCCFECICKNSQVIEVARLGIMLGHVLERVESSLTLENVQIWPMLIKPMEANKVLKYAEEISFKSLHRFCFAFVCAQGWVSRLKFCFYGAWKSP